MPGPTGMLDQLTAEQQAQLITWLEIHPAKTVLQKVSAAPPEGFGIHTHLTSLRRFYARKQREDLIETLELARAQATDSGVAEDFISASSQLLAGKAFEILTAPDFRPKHFSAVAKWISRQRDQDLPSFSPDSALNWDDAAPS